MRFPIRPFKNGRVHRTFSWGAYAEPGTEGAFVAIELRLPHRMALGLRIPGMRAARAACRVVETLAAHEHVEARDVSPLDEYPDGVKDLLRRRSKPPVLPFS